MIGMRISGLWGWIAIIVIVVCSLSAQGKYGGGSGGPNDPYQIKDANHMQAIGADANDWDKHFKLMADIDLGQFDGKDGREKFNVIGTDSDHPFSGVFDGNSHIVSNFTYDSNGVNHIGLFGYARGVCGYGEPKVVIKHLGLIDANVSVGTGMFVGSLVGYMSDGYINKCYAIGGSVTVVEGGGTGGLAGRVQRGLFCTFSEISYCHAALTVTGDNSVGGLVGSHYYGSILAP